MDWINIIPQLCNDLQQQMRRISKTGIIRSRFDLFVACKDTIRKKAEPRFARNNTSKIIGDSQNKGLLNKQSIVEMATMTSLPPEWVDKYEDIQILIRDVDEIKKQISILYAKRMNTMSESEESQLDRQIFQKAQQATKKICLCQRQLKDIRNSVNQDSSDRQVCNNLSKALAVQIQEKTRQIRGQQRAYVEQRKRLESSTKVSFLDLAVEKTLGGQIYQDDMQQMELEDLQLQVRNKQILELVKTINELNEIYKQLNEFVVIQGTLLDRIDVNLDQSINYVKKGKQQLGKALEHQKSPLACRIILGMVAVLVILGIVLIVKHAR